MSDSMVKAVNRLTASQKKKAARSKPARGERAKKKRPTLEEAVKKAGLKKIDLKLDAAGNRKQKAAPAKTKKGTRAYPLGAPGGVTRAREEAVYKKK